MVGKVIERWGGLAIDEERAVGNTCDEDREACRTTGASRSLSSLDEVSEADSAPCFTTGSCFGGAGLGACLTAGLPVPVLLSVWRSAILISLPASWESVLVNNNLLLLLLLVSTSDFTNPAAALVPGLTVHLADKSLSRFFGLHISSPRLLFAHTLLTAFRASSSLLSSSHFLATLGSPSSALSLARCLAASSCFISVSLDIRGTPDTGRWISDMRVAFLACARCCSRSYSARCTERV